jgi:hypothetical protein
MFREHSVAYLKTYSPHYARKDDDPERLHARLARRKPI